MSNKEIWIDILGYEDIYQVSNRGRVKSFKRNSVRILNPYASRGYPTVSLIKNRQRKSYRVHRLVAIHFLGDFSSTLEVNHKDRDKENNCIENLEWCSHVYNMNHAFKTGVNSAFGENSGKTNLTETDILDIRSRLYNGEKGINIAKLYKVTRQCISNIKLRKTWNHL